MHVKLLPAQEEFIQQKIAAGAYPSPDAVISEAINLLQQQEHWAKDAGEKIEVGWNEAKSGMLLCEDALLQRLAARKVAWKSDRHQR